MGLEDIMQSEISQTEEEKYCIVSLIHGIFFFFLMLNSWKQRRKRIAGDGGREIRKGW